MNDTTTITVIIIGACAVLALVKFWRYVVSAAILVAVVMICATIFAGYTPTTNGTTNGTCYTPGGIETACK